MLIGLHGESRAGKDTVAKILRDKEGFEWHSFAQPLRAILFDINPRLEEDSRPIRSVVAAVGWDEVKKKYHSSVEMMIALGQSARDNISQDVWVDALFNQLGDYENVVISDVRQPNEFERIKMVGGEVWLVRRPGTVSRGMDHLLDNYTFDTVLDNNGSIDDLEILVLEELQNYGAHNRN